MEATEVERTLDAVDEALTSGEGLTGTGFWQVVAAVKRDPDLAERFGARIARIDRRAFERWALFTVPATLGTIAMVLGTLIGLAFVWLAYSVDRTVAGLLLLAGTGVTLVTTHGLAHLVVGSLSGMRFTHWFVGAMTRPQPGVKVDYATYLAAPARRRAWMHAAGAVVTKTIPFLALGPALVIGVDGWVTSVLVVLGIAQIVTDVVWSTKSSDWKKYRREMRYAD